jgi:hypothetical protein
MRCPEIGATTAPSALAREKIRKVAARDRLRSRAMERKKMLVPLR